MIDLKLQVNENYGRELAAFGPALKTVFARGINKGIRGAKTDAVKAVRQHYNVKSSGLRKKLNTPQSALANRNKLRASLFADNKPMSLALFGALPNSPEKKRPRGGVSVKVKKSRKRIPHSFVAQMKSGHVGVFVRKGKDSLPIDEKVGPSAFQMTGSPSVFATMTAGAEQRTSAEIDHGLIREVEKINKRYS